MIKTEEKRRPGTHYILAMSKVTRTGNIATPFNLNKKWSVKNIFWK